MGHAQSESSYRSWATVNSGRWRWFTPSDERRKQQHSTLQNSLFPMLFLYFVLRPSAYKAQQSGIPSGTSTCCHQFRHVSSTPPVETNITAAGQFTPTWPFEIDIIDLKNVAELSELTLPLKKRLRLVLDHSLSMNNMFVQRGHLVHLQEPIEAICMTVLF